MPRSRVRTSSCPMSARSPTLASASASARLRRTSASGRGFRHSEIDGVSSSRDWLVRGSWRRSRHCVSGWKSGARETDARSVAVHRRPRRRHRRRERHQPLRRGWHRIPGQRQSRPADVVGLRVAARVRLRRLRLRARDHRSRGAAGQRPATAGARPRAGPPARGRDACEPSSARRRACVPREAALLESSAVGRVHACRSRPLDRRHRSCIATSRSSTAATISPALVVRRHAARPTRGRVELSLGYSVADRHRRHRVRRRARHGRALEIGEKSRGGVSGPPRPQHRAASIPRTKERRRSRSSDWR